VSMTSVGATIDKFTPNLSDYIVRDGLNSIVPCNADPVDSAPSGSYICNKNNSICLEKWKVVSILESSD
jgi:hypothetical protein